MKRPGAILPMALILCSIIGFQNSEIIARGEVPIFQYQLEQDSQANGDKAELQQPPYPIDDTPCAEVNPARIQVPEDFYIVYSEGPTHAEWGADRSVAVSADGSYSIKESSFSRDEQKEVVKIIAEGQISPMAVHRIYAKVVGCRFFELKQSYWNQDIRDGERELMRVVARGRSHYVSIFYYQVQRFESIRFVLTREINNPTR